MLGRCATDCDCGVIRVVLQVMMSDVDVLALFGWLFVGGNENGRAVVYVMRGCVFDVHMGVVQ